MLRKSPNRQSDWDRLLKYTLFAYRATPHTNTGISPFEIIHGMPMRGLLDVLHEGWLAGELKEQSVIEWVNELKEAISKTLELTTEREIKAKAKMKDIYDRKAIVREFKVGDQVLARCPDLQGKLNDLWEGPFTVTDIVSPVTYRLAVPSRRSKNMVSHVNRLKLYHTPEALVRRIVVAEDTDEECMDAPSRTILTAPSLNDCRQKADTQPLKRNA